MTLDEVLRECVDHAYEVMDAKSFADPYAKAKKAILSDLEKIIEENCIYEGSLEIRIELLRAVKEYCK